MLRMLRSVASNHATLNPHHLRCSKRTCVVECRRNVEITEMKRDE
ncbi:hypothetical protein [Pseudomonas phage PfAC08]